jgi:hypothetical protein
MNNMKCEQCDVQFTPKTRDQRFCSATCRQKSFRQRNALRNALPEKERPTNVVQFPEYTGPSIKDIIDELRKKIDEQNEEIIRIKRRINELEDNHNEFDAMYHRDIDRININFIRIFEHPKLGISA